MIHKLRRVGNDTLLYACSMVPIGLTLLLHALHMFLVPMLLGLGGAKLHEIHSEMDAYMDMNGFVEMNMKHQGYQASGTLITLAVFILNLAGIVYGCWLLWHSWKKPAKGRLAVIRSLISGFAIACGVFIFVWMQ